MLFRRSGPAGGAGARCHRSLLSRCCHRWMRARRGVTAGGRGSRRRPAPRHRPPDLLTPQVPGIPQVARVKPLQVGRAAIPPGAPDPALLVRLINGVYDRPPPHPPPPRPPPPTPRPPPP